MRYFIQDSLNESEYVHNAMVRDAKLHEQLMTLASWCTNAFKGGGTVFFAGNGGSFADSQHLAAEFVSRLRIDRRPLPSLALGTNNSVLSAIGNDYGYDQVFSRELDALASEKDIFIPISTSGNSSNIISAINIAAKKNMKTMAFTGKSGGEIASKCPCLHIPSNRTERIQEGHILLGHILCGMVEYSIFTDN